MATLGSDRQACSLQRFPTKTVVLDDTKFYFGNDEDASIEYDEDGNNVLVIAGADWRFSDTTQLQFGDAGDATITWNGSAFIMTGANAPTGNWTPSTGAWDFSSVTGMVTPVGASGIDTGIKVQELTISGATMYDMGLSDLIASNATAVMPVGAIIKGYAASVVSFFTGGGNTTAILMIGPAGATTGQSDWGPATNASVSTVTIIGGNAQGGSIVTTACAIRATVRTSSDCTAVVGTGKARIKVFYSEFF